MKMKKNDTLQHTLFLSFPRPQAQQTFKSTKNQAESEET